MRERNQRPRKYRTKYILDHVYVCEECNGTGRVEIEFFSYTYGQDMKVAQPCQSCKGKGIISWHDEYDR